MARIDVNSGNMKAALREASEKTGLELTGHEEAMALSRGMHLVDRMMDQSGEAFGNLFRMAREVIFEDRPVKESAAFMRELARALGGEEKIAHLSVSALIEMGLAAPNYETFVHAVEATEGMVYDEKQVELAAGEGATLQHYNWADNSRGSGVFGKNSTDLCLAIQVPDPRSGEAGLYETTMIRLEDNYSDEISYIPADKLRFPVGNAQGGALKEISLKELLDDPSVLFKDASVLPKIEGGSLFAKGTDEEVIASPVGAFFPVTKDGTPTQFTPSAYSYGSFTAEGDSGAKEKNSAVLAVLMTKDGVSAQFLGGQSDAQTWGEQLWQNRDGQAAWFTASRESVTGGATNGGGAPGSSPAPAGSSADGSVLRVVLIPLEVPETPHSIYESFPMALSMAAGTRGVTDMERATVGIGEIVGPFPNGKADMPVTLKRAEDQAVRVVDIHMVATETGVGDAQSYKELIGRMRTSTEGATWTGPAVATNTDPVVVPFCGTGTN